MMRSLPVVGHPIPFKTMLRAFRRNSRKGSFLREGTSDLRLFLVSSGSAALTLSLKGLKHNSRKRQVILPAYTCPSVIASVIKARLKPILCDLRAGSFHMDLEQVASKIGVDTLAVIAVHLFGIPENILELEDLTRKKGIFLIEDAAQAFENRLPSNGLRGSHTSSSANHLNLGSFGDIGIFSFGRGKPLSLLAGGAILVNNPELQKSIQRLYDFLYEPSHSRFRVQYLLNLFLYSIFYHPNLYWIPQAMPWLKLGETVFDLDFEVKRINPCVIRFGSELILHFGEIRKKRLEIARIYVEKLKKLRDEFVFFPEFDKNDIALLRFPVIFRNNEKRDRILSELKKRGLGATGMYPVPLNEQKGVQPYLPGNESYPNAKFISERLLTLPLHTYIRLDDVDCICKIFRKNLAD